jgi:Putative MetA-pathway of phenol degradation
MTKIICSIILVFFSFAAFAQVEKIETDRLGETNTPSTVPSKWMQFETGSLLQIEKHYPSLKDYFIQHPSLLLKYGIGSRFELRLITDLATIKEENVNGTTLRTGITNVQLGGKINFLKEKGLRPKVSLIAHYDFRRFRTLYKGDTIDAANFRFSMQHTLSNTISIGYNIGMKWKRFRSSPAYIYTLSPRFNITEKWFAFVEVFGFIWKKYSPEHSIDFGAAYNISDNFKIDASAGFGLNKKAPDNFYSIGASFRFKTRK